MNVDVFDNKRNIDTINFAKLISELEGTTEREEMLQLIEYLGIKYEEKLIGPRHDAAIDFDNKTMLL